MAQVEWVAGRNAGIAGPTVDFDLMDQVVADHIVASTPIGPAIQGRIVCPTSGGNSLSRGHAVIQ